jgi:hypothetical protein
MKLHVLCLATLIVGVFSSSANAENFDFSFSTGDPFSIAGTPVSPGTVTGEIIGLNSSGASTPTDIIITTAPSVLSLTGSNDYNVGISGSFTVTGGAITAVDDVVAGNNIDSIAFSRREGSTALDNVLAGQVHIVGNQDGFSGVNFNLDPSSIPEPSTYAMMLGGLALLGFCVRRKLA